MKKVLVLRWNEPDARGVVFAPGCVELPITVPFVDVAGERIGEAVLEATDDGIVVSGVVVDTEAGSARAWLGEDAAASVALLPTLSIRLEP